MDVSALNNLGSPRTPISYYTFIACGWGKYETFPEPACYKCFIIPNEPKKTHTWKILLANIFGALSQTFKNHIHNKGCVPSAFDVFLSKSVNSGRKMREASEVVEYDFYFTEYDFCPVITCSDFCLLSNQINLFMVVNIWGIINIYVVYKL